MTYLGLRLSACIIVLTSMGACDKFASEGVTRAAPHSRGLAPTPADIKREQLELQRNIMATRLNQARSPGAGCVKSASWASAEPSVNSEGASVVGINHFGAFGFKGHVGNY